MARIAGGRSAPQQAGSDRAQYIYGIGNPRARKILEKANVDALKKVQDLGEEEVNHIRQVIEDEGDVEGDLRKDVSMHIKRLIDIQSYRGTRHRRSLPVRGQRTHTNARTRKGPRRAHGRQEESDGEDIMAKPEQKPAAGKSGKNKKFKKRERKNVPLWYWPHSSLVQQHHRDHHRPDGQHAELEELGFARLPRFAQGHALRGAAGCSNAASMARDHGLRAVDVRVAGPGSGRESAIRACSSGHRSPIIRDVTPVPHNGCRPPKRRRV